ncbi:MAG: cadmium-translocating P-type ATPase [Clostridia bacterium]|nr:cadmium-translocating P-type ATPase [Clostridia bacterium]
MTRKQRQVLLRIIVSAVFLIAAVLIDKSGKLEILSSVFYLTAYFIIGYDIIMKAASSLRHRRFIDENFLMSIASVGAVVLGEFFEGVAVMLFYQVGELFQSCAVAKSRKSIAALMNIRPDKARVIINGEEQTVSPEKVAVDDVILVGPGEKIPLDGVVLSGEACIDASPLTGESVPVSVKEGSEVAAGCICTDSLIKIRVTKSFAQSSVSKILELVENSMASKSKSERFITKFARYYTPIVVIAAILLAAVPQLFISAGRMEWVRRALIFLVISCPCALVISVPLSFFGGIGSASRRGILVKGSNYLEALAKCDTVVFDKTGTLTKGSFTVTGVYPEKMDERILVAVCAAAEQHSNHPIAKTVVAASGDDYKRFRVSNLREVSGKGSIAVVEKWEVAVGNAALMEEVGVSCTVSNGADTVVHIAVNGEYEGYITVADTIKENAEKAVLSLKEAEIENIVMLTGDKQEVAERVASALHIEKAYHELLPADKVEILEGIISSSEGKVIFAGDGINDAPVLTRADVGIAMGALGSDAAIEAADVVIADDDINKIPLAIKIARKTCDIATQNIVFALGIKALFLLLGAFGATGMAGAVFADVGVAIIAILNSMRTLKYKN